MRYIVDLQTRIGQARLVGLAGVALAYAGLALWALFVFAFFPPDERFDGPDMLDEAVTANALFALLALLGVLLSRWPVLSAFVLLIAFVGAFVVWFGWYFLLTPSPLALAGVGSLLYLFSAGLMVAAALEWPSRREEV